MTAPRMTVTFGLDADAYLVAHAVDRALEGAGYHVSVEQAERQAGVEQAEAEDEVWISRRNGPISDAVRFEPGQTLVVTYDEGWRIEPAPETAVTP